MRYAVAKKGCWWVIVIFPTKEKALESIKGKEHLYEVREVIDEPTKRSKDK